MKVTKISMVLSFLYNVVELYFAVTHFEKDFWAPGFHLCEMEMKV